jgi:hypothetical protein
MWNQPYLETCCRAALHRLSLSQTIGRPPGLKDGGCLQRLASMGLALQRADRRYEITLDGRARHRSEVMGHQQARLGSAQTRKGATPL